MAWRFPFTSLHEINLDWILEKVKEFADLVPPMSTAVEEVQSLQSDVEQAVADAQSALENANEAAETAAEALEVAEQAASGTIANGAVTTDKLANSAVTSAKIADRSISGNDIALGTIQTGNLSEGCVTSEKILDGTIAADDLGPNCVTTVKLYNGAVTTLKLADNAVATAKLGQGAVTTAKMADNAVNYSKLAPELKRVPIVGYFPTAGRSDGDVALWIPCDKDATAATPNSTTQQFDLYGAGGSGGFTGTIHDVSIENGGLYFKITPTTSVATVAPNATVAMISMKGSNFFQLS